MNGNKKNWSAGDYFLVFFGCALVFIFAWAILGKIGLVEPFENSPPAIARPKWDNKACLQNEQYRIRRADPAVSDDDLFGQVARNCVLMRQEWEQAH